MLGDGGDESSLLRADGEAVRGVFYIAAGDDFAGLKQKGDAYEEVTVGRVGVVGGGGGAGVEFSEEIWRGVWRKVGHAKSQRRRWGRGRQGDDSCDARVCPIRMMWTS